MISPKSISQRRAPCGSPCARSAQKTDGRPGLLRTVSQRRTITKRTAVTATSSRCGSVARPSTSAIFSSTPRRRNGCRDIYLQPDEPLVADGEVHDCLLRQGSAATARHRATAGEATASSRTSGSPSCRRKASERSSVARVASGTPSRRIILHSPFLPRAICLTTGLCCVQLTIDRDWTWDALDGLSFVIERTVRFTHDAAEEAETKIVGEIEVKRTASFEVVARSAAQLHPDGFHRRGRAEESSSPARRP